MFLFCRLKRLSVLLKTRGITTWKVSSPNRKPDRSWRVWDCDCSFEYILIGFPHLHLIMSWFFIFFYLEQYQKVMRDQMNLNNERTHLENQFKHLQQRLEITTELYQQKENALQQWELTLYSLCAPLHHIFASSNPLEVHRSDPLVQRALQYIFYFHVFS